MKSWYKDLVAKLKKWWASIQPSFSEPDPVDPVDTDTPVVWPAPCTFIRAAMVTPMFVYQDAVQVKSQSAALKAAGFNAVASLVDLQSGRNYIFPGRYATMLAAQTWVNIRHVLAAGLTPIVIVRNDWAVRTRTGTIPSVGSQPANSAAFYSASIMTTELQFLNDLKSLYPYIHIQLSIEPDVADSAAFALGMARHLRAAGFKGRLLLNPAGAAMTAHYSVASQLAEAGCEFACSWHEATPPPAYKVWNTDGRTAINSGNVQSVLSAIRASGKEYILWSQELANAPTGIPAGYLTAATTPTTPTTPTDPVQTGDNNFLWKPVSDSYGGRAVFLTPANIDIASATCNGEQAAKHPRANGNRQHFRLSKTGSAYGTNVKVIATLTAGGTKTWTVPDGAARWSSR